MRTHAHASAFVLSYTTDSATTSLEIAKFFKKRHDVVLVDVRNIMDNCPESFIAHNFVGANYIDDQAKNRPMFIIFRTAYLLVMGYTGPEAMRFGRPM